MKFLGIVITRASTLRRLEADAFNGRRIIQRAQQLRTWMPVGSPWEIAAAFMASAETIVEFRDRMDRPPLAPPELPDGVWERTDGTLVCECRVCERAMPIECEPEEFDPDMAYCGGSPRCCP